jgi:hypothetical protein
MLRVVIWEHNIVGFEMSNLWMCFAGNLKQTRETLRKRIDEMDEIVASKKQKCYESLFGSTNFWDLICQNCGCVLVRNLKQTRGKDFKSRSLVLLYIEKSSDGDSSNMSRAQVNSTHLIWD